MLLRCYWQVFMRRWWIVVALLALVAFSYLAMDHTIAVAYSANMRFVVGIEPEQLPDDVYGYDRYYTWLTSEYLIDDLSEVVKSERFASDVAARSGIAVQPGAIQGATLSGKLHRILSISVSWPDAQQLSAITAAITEILTSDAESYFKQLGTDRALISVIDSGHPTPVSPSLRGRLDLPIRLMLALAVGILLAFVFDYLDTTIRSEADLTELGINVLATIPGRSPLQR